ncbi:auxin-binding protein ABP19a [Trifolium repens]|nr:auxin-binding protein ABP19a [Trifolium repens]
MNYIILYFFALLSSYTTSYASSDFCVADLKLPNTPSGYPCKSETKVTVNDFVFSGLFPGNTEGPFNYAVKPAFVNDLPGLNGLGISVVRGDIGINGTAPMHIHPDATELLIMLKGQLIAGFITPTKLIVKTLNPGDVMVFPKGLMQFLVNSGVGKASVIAAYSSTNPSVQIVDVMFFGNTLSTAILEKTTGLDPAQIKKLKAVFGGSG